MQQRVIQRLQHDVAALRKQLLRRGPPKRHDEDNEAVHRALFGSTKSSKRSARSGGDAGEREAMVEAR